MAEQGQTGKRYYWLKLQEDFFDSKRVKKLRKLAGGDTFTIIYLKMQLLALKSEGILRWTGLEDDFASELALDLDEKPENVAVTLQYLLSCGLAETEDHINFLLPWVLKNTGSEGSSAKRMRDLRARQSLSIASQCDATVTAPLRLSDGEKEKEIEGEGEKEIEKKKEIPLSEQAGRKGSGGRNQTATQKPVENSPIVENSDNDFEKMREAAIAKLQNHISVKTTNGRV